MSDKEKIIGYVAVDSKGIPYYGTFSTLLCNCKAYMKSTYPLASENSENRIIALTEAKESEEC